MELHQEEKVSISLKTWRKITELLDLPPDPDQVERILGEGMAPSQSWKALMGRFKGLSLTRALEEEHRKEIELEAHKFGL